MQKYIYWTDVRDDTAYHISKRTVDVLEPLA
jgi:hypothetical protein